MTKKKLKALLEQVRGGKVAVDDALDELVGFPYKDIEYAKLDYHRELRQGFPEVIYCKDKSEDEVINILKALIKNKKSKILATRVREGLSKKIKNLDKRFEYKSRGQVAYLLDEQNSTNKQVGNILIISAGTSDMGIVEEAYVTSYVLGNKTHNLIDVGVAGIHRLFDHKKMLDEANVIIVVAGMDGALASVVGGLVSKPVIGVPSSVGYGASFQGLSALLAMLNSCSPNVLTVNIDNGFGAAYAASIINQQCSKNNLN